MRRPIVAGNWKMHMNLPTARELIATLRAGVPAGYPVDVAVCPPSVYLFPAAKALDGSTIRLGAQNLWPEPKGAFTGELAPPMIRETGATLVILGHSERRHTIGGKDASGKVVGEDDALINRKVKAALSERLTPILCVGETLTERDAGQTNAVLERQIRGGLDGLTAEQVAGMVVAYEPVWAIGTGRNATAQQADEAHKFIRKLVLSLFGTATAEGLRIQYGGSVKASNAAELMRSPDVDGALVGGASLVADDFLGIIRACAQAKGLL